MTAIVGIIGPGGEGGTFLDWSLHYLLGDETYKIVLVDRLKNTVHGDIDCKLQNNPMTVIGNAHKHKKTHPTQSTIKSCIDLLKTIHNDSIKLHTLYIVASDFTHTPNKSYLDVISSTIPLFDGLKLIQMYHSVEIIDDLTHRTYTKIPDNKETVTDIRNRIRLASNDRNKIINDPNVYSLNIKDMFYHLDIEIFKIVSWLNLPIVQERYDSWLAIYKEWQLAQKFVSQYGPQA